jgi:hypothetical protein
MPVVAQQAQSQTPLAPGLSERLDELTNVDLLARSVLDLVYQCFNSPRCEGYDKEGKWQVTSRY